MSAERLRQAATLLRERAEAATAPGEMHPYGDESLPETPIEKFGDEMRGYLGGSWGEFAAIMSPPVALALADWLWMEADHAAGRGAVCGSCVDQALTLADALLGDAS